MSMMKRRWNEKNCKMGKVNDYVNFFPVVDTLFPSLKSTDFHHPLIKFASEVKVGSSILSQTGWRLAAFVDLIPTFIVA